MQPENLGHYYESILEKEVRRKGGIYYTPPLIVEYMVANTVGELLKGKTPEEAAKIRIVDPACGGGVFLLGVYQFLLDWHEKQFGKLTLTQRQKILNDSIFGVDIDPQAVGITKYCLSMKCIDGTNFSLDLDENIRSGNSLVETEFPWQREFPHVFNQGGFDIVIGNPPYGAKYPARSKEYFLEHYQSAKTTTINGKEGKIQRKGSLDTFSLFIESGFNRLKENGYLAFIVPIAVISSDSMTALHELLFNHCKTIKVSSYAKRPVQVFLNACVANTIISFVKTNTKCERILTTKMNRLAERDGLKRLLMRLKFTEGLQFVMRGRIPKISLTIENRILKKLFSKRNATIRNVIDENGKPIYYRSSGGRYYNVITNSSQGSTKEKVLSLNKKLADTIGAILSSSLFWWYQQVYTNGLDLKSYEIESFPIPIDALTAQVRREIEKRYERYLQDIERNVIERESQEYKHVSKFKEYKIRYSKALIDAIDDMICPLYGLTDEELEFIKSYELRFRIDD